MRTPKLLLKPSAYKTDKLYSILPDDGGGDFTVSSYVGNGTRVNKDGIIETVATDTPRIDYRNGPGLLLEPTRKNLIARSFEYSDASWTKNAGMTVTVDDGIAPNGIKEACLLEDTTPAGTSENIRQTITFDDATAAHTFSVFIKFNTSVNAYIYVSGTVTGDLAGIDLDPQGNVSVVFNSNSIMTDYYSERYADDWWRLVFSVDMNDTDTTATFQIHPNRNPNAADSIWAWGAQVEEGAFATSHIPTTGTALTRAYDYILTSNLLTSGLIGETSAFILFKAQDLVYEARDGSAALFSLGSTNGRVYVYSIGTAMTAVSVFTDTSTQTYTLTKSSHNIGFNINGDGVDFWVDGVKVLAAVEDFYLTGGVIELTGQGVSGKLKEIALYDSYITDAEAKALTQ